MVVTDDASLADRVRRLRSHGMTALSWDHERGHAAGYQVLASGFNYRLDKPRAAIGLVQLARLGAGNVARARHDRAGPRAARRRRRPGASARRPPGGDDVGGAPRGRGAAARDPSRVGPRGARRAQDPDERALPADPPVLRLPRSGARPLPWTEDLGDRRLTLPLFPHMTEAQVREVANALDGRPAARRAAGSARA